MCSLGHIRYYCFSLHSLCALKHFVNSILVEEKLTAKVSMYLDSRKGPVIAEYCDNQVVGTAEGVNLGAAFNDGCAENDAVRSPLKRADSQLA
jgi:hypothetical protein